jgi:hypothetical protein
LAPHTQRNNASEFVLLKNKNDAGGPADRGGLRELPKAGTTKLDKLKDPDRHLAAICLSRTRLGTPSLRVKCSRHPTPRTESF